MNRPVGDHRSIGNSYDRRRRVEWLIKTFGSPTGKTIRCFHCHKRMRSRTSKGRAWEVDRFPVCGHNDGRYVRGNIVPSCKTCNATRCHPVAGGKCRKGVPAVLRRKFARAA